MKFLIDFVSCCGSSGCEISSMGEASGSSSARRRSQSEETRGLVSGSATAAGGGGAAISSSNRGRRRARKRSRAVSSAAADGGSGTGLEGEWKPTLAAIAEDRVALAVEEKERREKEERAEKRKGSRGGGSRSRDGSSFYGEDCRRSGNQFAGVFPGFPAAPFMI
ncbi:unnamed protein product [Linum trigynum]|uniref:Uncharacterized protein n=1 Tax=Linum trigynum TaxID=586398 RepID=A0AAV2C8Q0_9ROSI